VSFSFDFEGFSRQAPTDLPAPATGWYIFESRHAGKQMLAQQNLKLRRLNKFQPALASIIFELEKNNSQLFGLAAD
jgi:hypothetical protein